MHLTGAPYHPATNGAAERLVQTLKSSLTKSATPTKVSLKRFLMQYRRTPLLCGYSPSELLNGRQIRTAIDVLIPSPAHQAQECQSKQAAKARQRLAGRSGPQYRVGNLCYALYCGPRRDKDPRWVPAVVTKVRGARSVSVRVYPRGPTWRSSYVQDTSQKRTWSQVKPQLHQLKEDILQMVERRRLLHRRKTWNQPMRRQQFKGNGEALGCQLVTSVARIGREGLHAQRDLHLPNRLK